MRSSRETFWRLAPAGEYRIGPFVFSSESESIQRPLVADNAVEELVDLARANERAAFWALAECLMSAENIAGCWAGCRARLNLAP